MKTCGMAYRNPEVPEGESESEMREWGTGIYRYLNGKYPNFALKLFGEVASGMFEIHSSGYQKGDINAFTALLEGFEIAALNSGDVKIASYVYKKRKELMHA